MKNLITAISLIILSSSCSKNNHMQIKNEAYKISETALEEFAKLKIFFGHQSVGYNIIDGIKELSNNSNVLVNIKEVNDTSPISEACLSHVEIGTNFNPKSKIDDFVTKLDNGLADSLDVAILKLCYVDINAETDVAALISYYTEKINYLQSKYPHLTIVHCTSPLQENRYGMKETFLKLFGKKPLIFYHNAKRNEYNDLMLSAFGNTVFDIAKIESTVNNNRITYTLNGKEYFQMAGNYTNDGGHLNQIGSKVMAKELIAFLTK